MKAKLRKLARLEKLREERESILDSMKQLVDDVEQRDGLFTNSEKSEWDDYVGEMDGLDTEIEELEAYEDASGGLIANTEDVELRDGNLHSFRNGKHSKGVLHMDRDKELRQLGEYFVSGKPPAEWRASPKQADLDVEGGFNIVPASVSEQILHDLDNMVYIRNLATIFRGKKVEEYGVPIMDSDVSDPEFTSEVSEAQLDTAMSFEKRALHPRRIVKAIKVSRDLLRLSTPDIASFITGRLHYKMAVTQENAFLNGVGAAEPLGIFTASDSGISSSRQVATGNTTTQIKADGLINCLYNLKSQYLQSNACRWIFHRDALKMIRKLKDGEGNYLWTPGIGQDRPATILGIPYLLSEYAPNTFTSGQMVGCIGDLKFYGIAEGSDISVQVLLEKYALENCNAYLIQHHVDGGPLLEEAFSMVTLGT